MNTATQSTLIVDGFTISFTSEELKQLLMPYGAVVSANVVKDQFNRSMSYGYVVMESEADARNAIEALNMQPFNGRVLRVAHIDIPSLPRRI